MSQLIDQRKCENLWGGELHTKVAWIYVGGEFTPDVNLRRGEYTPERVRQNVTAHRPAHDCPVSACLDTPAGGIKQSRTHACTPATMTVPTSTAPLTKCLRDVAHDVMCVDIRVATQALGVVTVGNPPSAPSGCV
jgi:hypothetical protein